jgi:hypothetical protein
VRFTFEQIEGLKIVEEEESSTEPAYHYLLRHEFKEHGTKIRAMNDRGDGSPEGSSLMASSINLPSSSGQR